MNNEENLKKFIDLRQKEKDFYELCGYYNGDIETNGELALIHSFAKKTDCLLDVGFNEGDVSKLFLSENDSIVIYGFEPNPMLNYDSSSVKKIFNCALSDENGDNFNFYISKEHHGTSSLNLRTEMNPSYRETLEKIEVKVTTLDALHDAKEINIQSPDSSIFLKIDVEGNEGKVLFGAEKFLKKYDVMGYFEYSHGWLEAKMKLQDTFYFLDSIGYDAFRITPHGLEHIRFFHHSMENYIYQNIFFAKKGYLDSIASPIEIPWVFSETKLFKFPIT